MSVGSVSRCLIIDVQHYQHAEPSWSKRGGNDNAEVRRSTAQTNDILTRSSSHRYPRPPILGAALVGSNATCSFCRTEQQAATPVFMLCDLATKANELKLTGHGGYIHVHVGRR